MINQNVKAIGEHIIVEVKKKKQNDSIIIIPEKYDVPEQTEAVVLSVGSKVKEYIKPGDVVLMSAFAGRNNMRKGENDTIRVVTLKEIYGIVE